MEIKDFVKVYDKVLPVPAVCNLIKYANTLKFSPAGIVGNNNENLIETSIRNNGLYSLKKSGHKLTDVQWTNILIRTISNTLNYYFREECNLDPSHNWKAITDISILKYEEGGFYKFHHDHGFGIPRTMSTIYLLNNDYEGGELCFRNPDGTGEYTIPKKANTMVVWPSNFLYQHTVKPVTKGTRFSVVGWAL